MTKSVRKVAMLVRAFAQLGCQQLQLNSLNVEILRDAKRPPEKHKNLIVRVWGWSGYFCELSPGIPGADHRPAYVHGRLSLPMNEMIGILIPGG